MKATPTNMLEAMETLPLVIVMNKFVTESRMRFAKRRALNKVVFLLQYTICPPKRRAVLAMAIDKTLAVV